MTNNDLAKGRKKVLIYLLQSMAQNKGTWFWDSTLNSDKYPHCLVLGISTCRSWHGKMSVSCEHRNESYISIQKRGKFFDKFSDYQCVKHDLLHGVKWLFKQRISVIDRKCWFQLSECYKQQSRFRILYRARFQCISVTVQLYCLPLT
jgi:hypothetical protein